MRCENFAGRDANGLKGLGKGLRVNRIRVLASGNHRIVHMILRQMSRHAGNKWHVFSSVADGLSAVGKAFEFRPDLIILDAEMPLLDGISSARRIRAFLPTVPIFICTSFALFRLEAVAKRARRSVHECRGIER